MLVASAILFWYLMLPSLMRLGFGVFQCRSVGDPNIEYLVIDFEEVCFEGRHLMFALFVGMPMLLLYTVLVPLGIMLRLYKAGTARLTHPSLLLRYGLMHSGYREEKYWWELVVLVRKYLVIAASTFLISDINQLQMVLGVLILALHLHDENSPFGEQELHRIEMLSLLLLTLVLWSGLYFSSSSHLCDTSQRGWCVMLVLVVIFSNIVYIMVVTKSCLLHWCTRNHIREKFRRSFERRRASPASRQVSVDTIDAVSVELTGANPLYEHAPQLESTQELKV